ncbi:MAG TPA: hypothetical protein VI094_14725, partial [Propionibacteriaceae bacterium]
MGFGMGSDMLLVAMTQRSANEGALWRAATMAGSRSLLDLALGYAYRCSGAKSGVSEMADKQGRGTGALNFERIYSTTVPA